MLDTGSIDRIVGSGRKPSLTSSHIETLIAKVKETPKISALKLRNYIIESAGISVTAQTIRNFLHTQGLWGRVARKVSLLSAKNINARASLTAKLSNYTLKAWDNHQFTDETKINLHGSDGRVIVWSRHKEALNPEHVVTTVKH